MCDRDGRYAHLWTEYVTEIIAELQHLEPNSLEQTTAIGNLALVISCMDEGQEKQDAKALFVTRLKRN